MTSKADILNAMQYSYFANNPPLNTTGAPRMTITYQYAGTSQPGDLPSGSGYTGWTNLTSAEKSAFRAQLAHIETFLNVDFVEVTGSADPDLNVGKVNMSGGVIGTGGYGIRYSSQTGLEWDGFVVFKNTLDLTSPAQANTMLHELGHALGLKHSFSAPALPAGEENNKFTVMSYSANPDTGIRSDAMMLYDVFALQDIWGRAAYNTGNTTYTGPRTSTVDVIWDTKGTDVLDASAYSTDVTLNLRPGCFSRFGSHDDVVIAYGTRIEKAFGGAGADRIIGNGKNNVLKGQAGNDTVTGGNGNDIIQGQQGADRLNGQNGDDRLNGGGQNDFLLGGRGNDTLTGGGGKDYLRGDQGDDLLNGGAGRDKFVFVSSFGADTIGDFEAGTDVLKFMNLGTPDQIHAHATEVASDVVFDFGGGDVLTVLNTTLAQISGDILT